MAARVGTTLHASCRGNLADSAGDLGLGYDALPEPVNMFRATRLGAGGQLDLAPSPAWPGVFVRFRVFVDLVIVASACPYEYDGVNGNRPTGMLLRGGAAGPVT